MSKACPVAVRIIRNKNGFLVKGRKTSVLCETFDEAWDESVLYFAGKKW
jgi:hypothetical protein